MSRYFPVYPHIDRMPVDISFVFENERPAGKHGFCSVVGDSFQFEDGTPARFWGVICNGAANFPDHEYAKKAANRLSQAGVNYVRFHQLDSEWATPNIYRLTAGKRLTTTRVLSEESLERLDYWIMCLKEKGIYSCVDMTTYRKFKSGDGVKFANQMKDNMKCYAHYDPVMINLQKEFCTNFWNHKNPYTGLCYKDDPFFFACIISNENDTFKDHKNAFDYFSIPYYDDMFRDMFSEWLKECGSDYDAYACTLYDQNDKLQVEFRIELERRYARTMKEHIRSLGVKIPICDTNWPASGGLIKAQEEMDFHAGNCYFYDWGWGEYEKQTANRHITDRAMSPLASNCTSRIAGHPMFMTEWDMPWPNCYRAEGPIWYPAVAALQGWSGMSIHTYAYGTNIKDTDLLGKEASTNAIGSVPYREGIFTVWNDPAKFGLFYHGALMLRRGDVSAAKKTIGSRVNTDDYGHLSANLAGSAMEIHKVVSVLDTTDVEKLGISEVYDDSYIYPREDPNRIVSDTGELWRDLKLKIGAVDTPRTKVVYGMLNGNQRATSKPKEHTVYLNGLTVRCETDFATIALSSLNDNPLSKSDNILLTAVGRASNTGVSFDGEKLLDYGHLPIQMEVIDAEIELETEIEDLRIWGINSDGYYAGRISAVYEDGRLKFHIGPHFPCEYYLIMQE